jgi:sugar lactone lactonase YvrE
MKLNIFLIVINTFLIKKFFSKKKNNIYKNDVEDKSIFTLVYGWDITNFSNVTCKDCIPKKIKISSNNEIFINFPNWKNNNITATLAKLDIINNNFIPFPLEEEDDDPKKKLFSVNSFEIYEDKLYALDQGNNLENNSTKIIVYKISKKTDIIHSYIFETDFIENLYLNDIVLDPEKNFAYISYSINNIVNNYNIKNSYIDSGIIIVDLNDISSEYAKAYKILENHISVIPDDTYYLHINDDPIYINESSLEPIKMGINGIALTCDYSMLYFTPLSSRMIYAIKTDDIMDIINNEKKINDIDILSFYKNDSSDGIIASSNGQIYLSALEKNSIYIHPNLDEDFNTMYYLNFELLEGNNETMWPSSLTLQDGKLYFISNQFNNYIKNKINYNEPIYGEYNFRIYYYDVVKDDNYLKGCKFYKPKFDFIDIFIYFLFIVVVIILLSFVLLGSNRQEEFIDEQMIKEIKE